ncbi:GntR family transcriptional regulator [Streptomyces noboritoensis]|uniref:GntR family transcriptional regulator n=1 Tax=Streptomyces noboritoensis TaxID=67337 RepID=A0ABV6TQY9_9ACTN
MALMERRDDPGAIHQPRYLLVARDLQQEIIGHYKSGQAIPTQLALMARYDVSRQTVQRAIGELRSWGLLEPGVRGKAPRVSRGQSEPQTLDDHVKAALQVQEVTLDVWSFTTERLSKVVTRQLEDLKKERGPWPKSITVRMLLPSLDAVHAVPYLLADREDPRPLKRLRRLIRMYAGQLEHSLATLKEESLVKSVSVEMRGLSSVEGSRLYIFNGEYALTSFYQPRKNKVELGPGDEVGEICDFVSGRKSFLWRDQTRGGTPQDEAYFGELRGLFEEYWSNVSEPLVLSE